MAKWLQQLETFIGGGSGGPRRIKAFRWLVLIGLLGAVMVLAASMLNLKKLPNDNSDQTPPNDQDIQQEETFLSGKETPSNPFIDIETEYESRLKELLESMIGVGTVTVMITIDSTEEAVVMLNEKQMQKLTEESDRNGASRHITEVSKDGQVVLYEISGSQTPFIVKKLKPKVRGVLITAQGAEDPTLHKLIAIAVSRGIDVPIHRIAVMPRKS